MDARTRHGRTWSSTASGLLRISSATVVVMRDWLELYQPSAHDSSRPISHCWQLPSGLSTITTKCVSVDFSSVAWTLATSNMKVIASPGYCDTATRVSELPTRRGIFTLSGGSRKSSVEQKLAKLAKFYGDFPPRRPATLRWMDPVGRDHPATQRSRMQLQVSLVTTRNDGETDEGRRPWAHRCRRTLWPWRCRCEGYALRAL